MHIFSGDGAVFGPRFLLNCEWEASWWWLRFPIPRCVWKPRILAAVRPDPETPLRDPGGDEERQSWGQVWPPVTVQPASYALRREVRPEGFSLLPGHQREPAAGAAGAARGRDSPGRRLDLRCFPGPRPSPAASGNSAPTPVCPVMFCSLFIPLRF